MRGFRRWRRIIWLRKCARAARGAAPPWCSIRSAARSWRWRTSRPTDASIGERLHDTAVQDTFEPGSTMKGLLASIALQDGTVTTSQRIYCENGAYTLAGRVIHDDSPHGWLDLGGIVEVSSNIGAAKIALKLGRERFYDGLRAFGLGGRTGIDLPGETAGILRRPASWREIDLANHGFGQGVASYADPARGRLRGDRQRRISGASVRGQGGLRRGGPAAADAYARDPASRHFAQRRAYHEPAVAGRGQRPRRHRAARARERFHGGGEDRHRADGESYDRRLTTRAGWSPRSSGFCPPTIRVW